MLSKFNLLYLDEPTNHLDIASREVLEDALEKFDGTLVAVSHDRYFIRKLANRILAFDDFGITDYIGTYEEYIGFNDRRKSDPDATQSDNVSKSKLDRETAKRELSEKRKAERRINGAKEEIKSIEKRISEISEEENKAATDHKKLTELYNEREELETRMLELMEFLESSGEDF